MTRFIFLTDTHWGAGDEGYRVQPKYDVRLPDILDALDAWIDDNGPIDLILHGGDMVHASAPENVAAALPLFRRATPVYHCLGNHDLTHPDSLDLWLSSAPDLFPAGSPEYVLDRADCRIHVVPNHYHEQTWYWESGSDTRFTPEQVDALGDRLDAMPGLPNLLVTHSPVFGLPPSQTGRDEPFHAPPAEFTRTVTDLAEARRVACVLGGHSHMNMHVEHRGVHYVTASSFVEAPFEFKLVEVDAGEVRMTTVGLADRVPFPFAYDGDRAYAQGRPCDRRFGHGPA